MRDGRRRAARGGVARPQPTVVRRANRRRRPARREVRGEAEAGVHARGGGGTRRVVDEATGEGVDALGVVAESAQPALRRLHARVAADASRGRRRVRGHGGQRGVGRRRRRAAAATLERLSIGVQRHLYDGKGGAAWMGEGRWGAARRRGGQHNSTRGGGGGEQQRAARLACKPRLSVAHTTTRGAAGGGARGRRRAMGGERCSGREGGRRKERAAGEAEPSSAHQQLQLSPERSGRGGRRARRRPCCRRHSPSRSCAAARARRPAAPREACGLVASGRRHRRPEPPRHRHHPTFPATRQCKAAVAVQAAVEPQAAVSAAAVAAVAAEVAAAADSCRETDPTHLPHCRWMVAPPLRSVPRASENLGRRGLRRCCQYRRRCRAVLGPTAREVATLVVEWGPSCSYGEQHSTSSSSTSVFLEGAPAQNIDGLFPK